MDTHLVISAIGHDRPGLIDEFSRAILDCGCNIGDSRMAVLGNELAMRFGRRRVIAVIMVGGGCMAAALGFSGGLDYALVLAIAAVYAVFLMGDHNGARAAFDH